MKEKSDIQLYADAFSKVQWKNEDKLKELLEAMGTMEVIIEAHLDKIAEYFPQLTDHSIKHSTRLWDYANIIVGNKRHYFNPLEAFILNSAFLLHDSGMCYSLLFKKDEIKNDPIYQDYLAINQGKLEKEKVEDEALFYTVRENHGSYALRIVKEELPSKEYFISSILFRDEFGDFIGKLAKSHTCNINYIEREFGSTYTSPRFPTEWTIDFKKIAYLLRTADAADIDNLRTPKTQSVISEMNGDSKEHWTFQKKLGFPSLEVDGQLIYSTNNPFKQNEQKAWWYCYNSLKVLDDELKNANNYFVSKKTFGFEAKGVKYIDDPLLLGKASIKTLGWDSINTSIRVSNPVRIAAQLGGKKLYGSINIAVRELIQNSVDAIHVYRMITGQENLGVGEITLSMEKENDNYFLTIVDNGIGMGQTLLTNELLDFGGSYWKTNKFYNDFRGLPSKGFESIGKYGIGFFSVFMLGEEITVTSWKYGESISEMRTLDFYDGLNSNPTLRYPTDREKSRIIDRGTCITIKLKNNPYEKDGIIFEENFKINTLKSLVQYYVPSADVKINVLEVDGSKTYLRPKEIESLCFPEISNYTNLKDVESIYKNIGIPTAKEQNLDVISSLPLQLIDVTDGDNILGRLLILPTQTEGDIIFTSSKDSAVVLAKGIRVTSIPGYIGYISTNEVVSIKRDEADCVIPYDAMRNWAKKQINQIETLNLQTVYAKRLKDLIITFDLYDDSFLLTQIKKEGKYLDVTIADFKKFVGKNTTITLYAESRYTDHREESCDGFINSAYGLDMKPFIIASELDKVNHTQKIITNIIKEAWGDYTLDIENISFRLLGTKQPYDFVWKFSKKTTSPLDVVSDDVAASINL